MTKIDETKQYKFSEIITMLENLELPEGTVLEDGYYHDNYIVERAGYGLTFFEQKGYRNAPVLCARLINYLWTIKLPKEVNYYLKAPAAFGGKYLNLQFSTGEYFFAGSSNTGAFQFQFQTKFTQSEIDAMPFDTSFFGEPIEAEVDPNE